MTITLSFGMLFVNWKPLLIKSLLNFFFDIYIDKTKDDIKTI